MTKSRNELPPEDDPRKSVLLLSPSEAKVFFLQSDSYCTFDLPPYFSFQGILNGVSEVLDGKEIRSVCAAGVKPRDLDDLNHTILTNKDGKFAWRPLQLIHPALYVALAHLVTTEKNWEILKQRFKRFSKDPRIQCLSLPVMSIGKNSDKAEQILNWWQEVEQRSIELSLEYEYVAKTDITDCYSSVYTHSLSWAVNGKNKCKKKEFRTDKKLLGNQIDTLLQDMSHGQTNGIPQGSVLMDFLAEIVLSYADLKISVALKVEGLTDFHILRYRDDYRIFTNNPTEGETILKLISQTLHSLGFKLNPGKTGLTREVIKDSVKADKMDWLKSRQTNRNLQKHLLLIHDFAASHPGSGHCITILHKFLTKLEKLEKAPNGVMQMIAITVDVAVINPRVYPVTASIVSFLLGWVDGVEKKKAFEKIKKRLDKVANSGQLQLWLQRISLPLQVETYYCEPLCAVVEGEEVQLWNESWIGCQKLKKVIDPQKIVTKADVKKLKPFIPSVEVNLFEGY